MYANPRVKDNDPTGYKSRKATEVKDELGIRAMDFPRYSPDLNPMDFFLWEEVERRMAKNAPAGQDPRYREAVLSCNRRGRDAR